MEEGRNPQIFTEHYRELYKDLYRFALYTLRNPHDAEDIVGDTVADAYESFHKLRRLESFRPWIFRILVNKCRRKMKEYLNPMEPLAEELQRETQDLAEHLQVRQAFASLSEEERLIISMHIFAGYTSKEIGRILHKNENTIRSKESRGLKKMEQMLQA